MEDEVLVTSHEAPEYYEPPELLELGSAEELIMGGDNCGNDNNCGCYKCSC